MKLFAHVLLAAALGAGASAALAAEEPAAAAKPAKPDPAKGDTIFNTTQHNGATCVSCHGAAGNSSIALNPKLAQQHPEYILKQLQEFKSGKRKDPTMKAMAGDLSEQDMHDVAAYLSSQKIKPGFSKDKDTVILGEHIYRGGIADRMVPACAGCHSPNGAGIPAQYARLGGQNTDYLVKTLTDFREGRRTNSPQMAGVTAKMNDREIKAVADYISGLR